MVHQHTKAPARDPAWNRDELTLALDLNVKAEGNLTGADFALVDQLSDTLNKMHWPRGVTGTDMLPKYNGAYLKVMNLRRFDPI